VIGFVVGVFFGVSALSSPLMGRLAERLGWARAMRAAALTVGAALGATPLVARSLLTFAAVMVPGGVGLALAHPAVNLDLARCTAVSRQGLVFGFKHAAIPASSALAGVALPLVAIPLGWRWVYALAAVVAVGAASLVPSSPGRFELGGRSPDEGETDDRRSPLSLLVIVSIGAGLGIFGTDALRRSPSSWARSSRSPSAGMVRLVHVLRGPAQSQSTGGGHRHRDDGHLRGCRHRTGRLRHRRRTDLVQVGWVAMAAALALGALLMLLAVVRERA
jgi:MFS family permease